MPRKSWIGADRNPSLSLGSTMNPVPSQGVTQKYYRHQTGHRFTPGKFPVIKVALISEYSENGGIIDFIDSGLNEITRQNLTISVNYRLTNESFLLHRPKTQMLTGVDRHQKYKSYLRRQLSRDKILVAVGRSSPNSVTLPRGKIPHPIPNDPDQLPHKGD